MKYLMQQQSVSLSLAIALLLLASGCEDVQKASVKGIVTMDGKPLTRGTVMFVAENKTNMKSAPGNIHKDGTYTVQIGQSGNLYVGEYGVAVKSHSPSTPHPQGGPPTPGELVTPVHYSEFETSGLRYNVRNGENVIDIALVSDQPLAGGEEAAPESESATEGASATKEAGDGAIEDSIEESEEASPAESGEQATPPIVEEAAAQ